MTLVLTGLLVLVRSSLAAEPQEPAPRSVRLRHERTIPLCVGRMATPWCFGDTLFAASEGSGLWVWDVKAGRAGQAARPSPVGTFGAVRRVFQVGNAFCALDNDGVLLLTAARDARWSAKRILLQANLRDATPADGDRFLALWGESADLYEIDRKSDTAKLVRSSSSRDLCKSCVAELTRRAREKNEEAPRFDIQYAATNGPLLVVEVGGCGVYAASLGKDSAPDVVQQMDVGRVLGSALYRGEILLATTNGLHLVPPPAKLPQSAGAEGKLLEEKAKEPAEGAKTRERGSVRLAAGEVKWLKLCRDALVFQSGQRLLSLPLEKVARVADYARGRGSELEELEEAPAIGEPLVLGMVPPKARFSVSDDARALHWVDGGCVVAGPLEPGGAEAQVPPIRARYAVVSSDAPIAFGGGQVLLATGEALQRFDAGSGAPAGTIPLAGMPGPVTELHDLDGGRLLARVGTGNMLLVLNAQTLAVEQTVKLAEGSSIVGAGTGADVVAVLARSERDDGGKRQAAYSCRAVRFGDIGQLTGAGGGKGWYDLSGDCSASYPVVDGKRAFIVSRNTYRPQGFCIGPGEKDIVSIPFLGGALDAAAADRLAFVARGLYGITVHDLAASDQFLYIGGVSAHDVTFYRVAVSGNRLAALTSQGIAIYSWEASSGAPKARELPRGAAGKPTLTDDGVDVTSWDYANMRGYASPLELKLGPPPDWRQGAHGVVYADPATGKTLFPPARMKPVRLRTGCELPHAFGTMACLGKDILIVGGNEGMNLEWWDISDSAHPRFVDRVEPSVGPPVQIEVRGNIVYLISNIWGGGLYVYDLSDLRKPVRLAGKAGLGERHASLCLEGDRAFVRLRSPGATIVTTEVKLPKAEGGAQVAGEITVLGQTELPLAQAAALPPPVSDKERPDAVDEMMRAADKGEAGEEVLKPTLKAEAVIECDPRPMLLHRGHLIVAACWTGQRSGEPGSALFVLPIGEKLPEKPAYMLRLDVACQGMGIWKDRLYLLGTGLAPVGDNTPSKGPGVQGRRVTLDSYDISNPAQPKHAGRWTHEEPAASAGDFTMSAGRLWCCIGGKAHAFDVGGEQPVLVATHELAQYGTVYYAHDDRLFIQDTRTGITVFNVSDPKAPRREGRVLAADGWGGDIDVWRGVAYVGSEGGNIDNYQLQILDVRDPLKPRLVELLSQFDWYCTPLAWGDYLWMSSNSHPTLLDISKTPTSPPVITQVTEQPGGIIQGRGFRPFRDMVVSGFGGQVRLLKVAPGGKVETVSVLPDVGGTATLACDRDHIYWGGQDKLPGSTLMANTVKVIDAADPKNLRVISSVAFPGYHSSASLEHRDGYLFLWLERFGGWTHPGFWWGYGSHGWLATIDVRDPKSPHVVSMYPAPTMIDSLGEMRLDGNMLYFASYMDNRLGIVDVSDPVHPVDVCAWRNWVPFYYVGDIDIDGEFGYLTTPYSVEVLDVPLSSQEPRGKVEWK